MAVGEGSLAAGEVARGGPVAARGEGKGWGRGGEEGAEEEGYRAPHEGDARKRETGPMFPPVPRPQTFSYFQTVI